MKGWPRGIARLVIGRTIPLDQIVEVYRYLESNQQIGEIAAAV
jgi:hypothetical protein